MKPIQVDNTTVHIPRKPESIPYNYSSQIKDRLDRLGYIQSDNRSAYQRREDAKRTDQIRRNEQHNNALYNNQHIWSIDPTRRITRLNVLHEFNNNKNLLTSSVNAGFLASGLGVSVPKTIASIAGGIAGDYAADKLTDGNPVAKLVGGFAGGMAGWKGMGAIETAITPKIYPKIIRAQDRSIPGKDGYVLNVDKDGYVEGVFRKDKPMINTTTDQKVTSHSNGDWRSTDPIILNPKVMSKSKVVSIEPTDLIFLTNSIGKIRPKDITVITGDPTYIKYLNNKKIKTKTSDALQKEFMTQTDAYINYWESSKNNRFNLLKSPTNWEKYDLLLNELITDRPTIWKYKNLERVTGLKSGVERNVGQAKDILDVYSGKIGSLPPEPPSFPNGRLMNLSKDRDLLQRLNYKNVFYDPASYVESDMMSNLSKSVGRYFSPNPSESKYTLQDMNLLKDYLQKISKPYFPTNSNSLLIYPILNNSSKFKYDLEK